MTKMIPKLAVFIVFLVEFEFICTVSSFFNIEELKSINYGIDIRSEPVVMKVIDDNADLNTVQLTSKYGQRYQCNFPNTAEQEKENEEAEKVAVETGIPDLLKPMETGPCLKMNNGWWNYEFCYGRYISQYHLTEDGKVEGEVLSLGIYESEYDWGDNPGQTDQEKKQSQLMRYHTQQYVNGTSCDLNGNHRKTEVRFLCEEGSGDYISRIDEPETCSYIMVVHTTRICHHPFLKPPTPTKTVAIACHPVLSVTQYQEYIDEIEAKEAIKKQEEEKKRLHEEELKILAKEKAKYLKQSQAVTDEEGIEEQQTEDAEPKVTNDVLKNFVNAAKGLQTGNSPLELKFQVLSDPAQVDEFIKNTIKEMEEAEKVTAKKEQGIIEDKGDEGDNEKLLEEDEIDDDGSKKDFNTDNMQKFRDYSDDDEVDITTEDVKQAVDALKKVQKDHVKTLSKLNRLKLEKLKRGHKSDKDEEEEEEGVVEDETDEEDIPQNDEMKIKDDEEKLFRDVEKHMKDLADKQNIFKNTKQNDDQEGVEEDLSDLMDDVDKQLKSMVNAQKEMERIGDDLNHLLNEDRKADEEIKTIKSKYQDKRGKLVDIKQKLKTLMEKQYDSIVKESEEELGMEEELDRTAATQELSKTLDGLLAKMEETEKEIQEVDKELEQFAEFDSEEKGVKSVPPVRDDLDQVKGPADNDGNDRVQVRVSRIKPGQKFSPNDQKRDKHTEALEKSVQEELAKAGLNNGDKIQVKIITSYYDGDDDSIHTLSEKDSETFRDLIVGLIGGTTESDKVAAKHQEQEDNYSFVFGKNKPTANLPDDGTSLLAQSQTDSQTHTDTHTDEDGS